MRRGGRGSHHNNNHKQRKARKVESSTSVEDQSILKAFREYREELDDKHDRYERVVKLSRDITIESKRIIFLLHCIDANQDNKRKILEEAKERLQALINSNFKAVAKELRDLDPYQYKWAFSPGLQEFIEAYTYMEYMDTEGGSSLSDWNALQKKMVYEEPAENPQTRKCQDKSAGETGSLESQDDDQMEMKIANVEKITEIPQKKFAFNVNPTEYILGLADLTGELMRRCVNSLGCGETQTCMEICKVLQGLHTGYVSLSVYRCRELTRKIHTMHQSVLKAEAVCYNVKVRGGEAAKWGAVNTYDKPSEEVDEGYY